MKNQVVIYQSKNGEIEFKGDYKKETLWASLQQIADLFDTDKSGISRHIKNIYGAGELESKATVAKIATVQTEGSRKVKRQVEYYNLDVILSVGYRVNSKTATKFRQWATKTLRTHLLKGYTLNKKRVTKNYKEFLKAVDAVQKLLPAKSQIQAEDALALVKLFADTWFSLDAYDKNKLPKSGANKKQIQITADELAQALVVLKQTLHQKKEASALFAQENKRDALRGIIGSVWQTVDRKDAYKTIEEKAAHLLYFIVKNHPFVDGNKRSGAFAFVWFLNKSGLFYKDTITPEALTALTLLIAESKPEQKEQMIGLILLLLKK